MLAFLCNHSAGSWATERMVEVMYPFETLGYRNRLKWWKCRGRAVYTSTGISPQEIFRSHGYLLSRVCMPSGYPQFPICSWELCLDHMRLAEYTEVVLVEVVNSVDRSLDDLCHMPDSHQDGLCTWNGLYDNFEIAVGKVGNWKCSICRHCKDTLPQPFQRAKSTRNRR